MHFLPGCRAYDDGAVRMMRPSIIKNLFVIEADEELAEKTELVAK